MFVVRLLSIYMMRTLQNVFGTQLLTLGIPVCNSAQGNWLAVVKLLQRAIRDLHLLVHLALPAPSYWLAYFTIQQITDWTLPIYSCRVTCFGKCFLLHLTCDDGNLLLRSVRNRSPKDTTSHPRRPESSITLL
jgi:hypothetical protein